MDGIPSWVHAGAKCICIAQHPRPTVAAHIAVGTRLIVRNWSDGVPGDVIRLPTLRFEGIYNDLGDSGEEIGYAPWRFAPLVTKSLEQDSIMFRKLLQGHKEREPV